MIVLRAYRRTTSFPYQGKSFKCCAQNGPAARRPRPPAGAGRTLQSSPRPHAAGPGSPAAGPHLSPRRTAAPQPRVAPRPSPALLRAERRLATVSRGPPQPPPTHGGRPRGSDGTRRPPAPSTALCRQPAPSGRSRRERGEKGKKSEVSWLTSRWCSRCTKFRSPFW